MEKSQKKFELPVICVFIILALMNDGAAIVADLGLLIPGVGIAVYGIFELFNILIWALIVISFIMTAGIGAATLLQVAGGIAEFFGLPFRTITVAIGIFVANHPLLERTANVAAIGMVTGGGGAVVGAAVTGAEEGEAVGAALQDGRKILSRPIDAPERSLPEISGGARPVRMSAEEAAGIPPPPIEEMKERLFEDHLGDEDELQDNEFKLAA